jgi:hypothetical protein
MPMSPLVGRHTEGMMLNEDGGPCGPEGPVARCRENDSNTGPGVSVGD